MISKQINKLLNINNKNIITVFLHGFMGNYQDLQHIANHNHIKNITDTLLLDLPNHGDSFHNSSFSIPDITHDIHNAIQELDVFSKYSQGINHFNNNIWNFL